MTYFINTTMLDTFKTTYTPRSNPDKGETWYVKLPGAVSLEEVVVKGVTAHTVELESQPWKTVSRYVREDVQFVEKVYNEVF